MTNRVLVYSHREQLVNQLLVIGYDIFPVLREERRGDGSVTTYQLYHTRLHGLSASGKHFTSLFGAPTNDGQAHDILDDVTGRFKVGTSIEDRLIPSKPRPFFLSGAKGVPKMGHGFVTGHVVTYIPNEKRYRRNLGPQFVPFLTVMVDREDGTFGYIYVRLYKEFSLPPEARLVGEIMGTWDYLRRNWDTAAEVNFVDFGGFYILTDELPEEEDRRPATLEEIAALKEKFAGVSLSP